VGLGGGGGVNHTYFGFSSSLPSFGPKKTHPEQKEETKANAGRQKKNPELSLYGTVRVSADGSRGREECFCECVSVKIVSTLSLLYMKNQLFLKGIGQ
jgi:hypothetical protein